MKYLKLYEDKFDDALKTTKTYDDVNKGDYIVLIEPDSQDLSLGFKQNEVYEITEIVYNKLFPFTISNKTIKTNIDRNQFRLATPEEIINNQKRKTAKGYNL